MCSEFAQTKYVPEDLAWSQATFEGFHLQVKNKHLLLRDTILVILRCLLPYTLSIEISLCLRKRRV